MPNSILVKEIFVGMMCTTKTGSKVKDGPEACRFGTMMDTVKFNCLLLGAPIFFFVLRYLRSMNLWRCIHKR